MDLCVPVIRPGQMKCRVILTEKHIKVKTRVSPRSNLGETLTLQY